MLCVHVRMATSFKRMFLLSEAEYKQKCIQEGTAKQSGATPSDIALSCAQEEIPPPPKPAVEKKEVSDRNEQHIQSMSTVFRARALRLYKWLKTLQPPSISWSDNGEVTIYNETLTGSNIVDLVVRAVNAVRRKLPPPG